MKLTCICHEKISRKIGITLNLKDDHAIYFTNSDGAFMCSKFSMRLLLKIPIITLEKVFTMG